MSNGFWNKLSRPFFALAPMADVTDAAFRRMFAKYGKPDVLWTEFVSADGLCSPGREALLCDLAYTEAERPIVAQIFGSKPANIENAAAVVRALGFDGLDINMGCPDKSIEKQGAGAAMIQDIGLAEEVIAAAKAGAGGLPVSVKTRVGRNKVEIDTWIPALLKTGLAALTVHARTRKEMSKVPANWDHIARVVGLRDHIAPGTLIIGNGDVLTPEGGRARAKETGCDGIMIGRGAFGAPWLFSGKEPATLAERFRIMLEHTRMFEELLGGIKSFAIMKKHYKAYIHGWEGAKELRMELMGAENPDEVERIATQWLAAHRRMAEETTMV